MNKKVIISNTIMFIFIVAFIIVFKSIFGGANTLIGVTTATAMLMLLQKDLTLSPIKNTILLILLNVGLGVAATLANMNMWIAIPINLITMFVLSYSLCYNLRSPMYLPFSLQYLFLLVNPVSSSELPMRFLALISGAIIIMLVQLIANRNNVLKKGNKLLINTCDNLIEKLSLKESNNNTSDIDQKIASNINAFRNIVYNKREQNFYLTEESKIKLNISVALEKICLLINEFDIKQQPNLGLILNSSLSKIKECLLDESKIKDNLKEYVDNHTNKNIDDLLTLKLLNNLSFIFESLTTLSELGKEHYNLIDKIEDVPNDFKLKYKFQSNYKAKSAKFSYAVRISVGITLAGFIMDYFHFAEGRWILFTILSLTTPIYEASKTKTRDRIFATIVGSIIIEVLFYLVPSVIGRTLILMITGYISNYVKEYRYNAICVTVSAIGAAALMGDTSIFVVNRLVFVAIGAALAILINKFVLPYDIEKDIAILKIMYINVIQEMLDTLKTAYMKKANINKINNLFITTTFIEERIKANNISQNDNMLKFISNERNLVCSIYELFFRLNRFSGNTENLDSAFAELKKDHSVNESEYEHQLENYIHHSHNLNEKLILSNIIEISNSLYILKSLSV